MPSGSKKRKSSKKPKSDEPPSSQGEPPELETGFEEGMAKDGEEMGDGSPSPKTTEGDAETMAEGGLEAKAISGEVLQGGHVEPEEFGKDFQTEEASAENCKRDLPSHTEPEIPVAMEGEAPAASEPWREVPNEIAQGEPQLWIQPEMDTPPIETDAAPVEIIPEDAPPTVFKGDGDQVLDAPPDGIKPEADIGQDEIELSVQSAPVERELERYAGPIVGESRMDESLEATAPEDIEPETVEAAVETKAETDAAPAEVEPVIDEAPAEMKSATDTALAHIEPDTGPEADGVPTDVQPEMGESLVEREPETDEAPADAEPETDVALADTERETDVAQVEMDALPVEIQPEIDAAGPMIETQTDAAVQEIETEIHTAVPEMEPETEAPIHTKPDEVVQAEIKPEPEPEPEVEPLAEVQSEADAENLDSPVEIDAQMEPLQAIEPDPEPEPEEAPPEIEPEPELESKETPWEIQPEPEPELEEPPQEIESEPKQPLKIDATIEPPQEIEPDPKGEVVDKFAESKAEEKRSAETELGEQDLVEGEVGASLEANPEPEVGPSEPEAEAEVPLEAEQEPEVEAQAGIESSQQDLVEIEPDQHDQQLHQQERGAELGELETCIPEDNQSQQEIVDAPELPVIKDELGDEVELPAISASNLVDDSISSIPVNEEPGNELESAGKPEEGEDLPVSEEATVEGVSDDRDPGADLEQNRETAVDNEQGVLDGLANEAEEGIHEQEKAGDDGHDEDQAVSASAGDGSEAVLPCEQELGIEQPPADVEECATEVALPKDQEEPLSDVIDVEECATEVSLPKDQELVTEKPQPPINEHELSMGLGAADEPPSAESELVELGVNTTLPSFESEMTSDPKDEAVMSADDIGEDEAALSTVAEAGSVPNDFDEIVHYEHELHTDFSSSEHIPDTRAAFDDTLSLKAPELAETGLDEELDSETPQSEQQRSVTESNGNECKPLVSEVYLLTDETDLNVGQGLGHPSQKAEVLPEGAEVATTVEESHASLAEEGRDYVQPISSPCLVLEEERVACKDGNGATASIPGGDSAKESPNVAESEMMSKSLSTEVDGQYNLSRSEAPSNDLLDLREESSIHGSEVNKMDETEIHAEETKELKGTEHNSLGGDSSNDANQAAFRSVSPGPEGKDIKGVLTFCQESTQEASLPVVVPTQARAMENVNVKSIERPSGGVIVEGRKKWLGCCGMLDVLLGKN